jgi:hypothetical protein
MQAEPLAFLHHATHLIIHPALIIMAVPGAILLQVPHHEAAALLLAHLPAAAVAVVVLEEAEAVAEAEAVLAEAGAAVAEEVNKTYTKSHVIVKAL